MRNLEEIDDKIKDLEARIAQLEENVKACASERNWDGARYVAEISDDLKAKVEALKWVCCEVSDL